MKSVLLVATIVAVVSFTACGGGSVGGNTTPPPASYTIGGTITGLSGTVVLQDNGGNNLSVSASGTFNFSSTVKSGSPYSVTVLTQPPGQTCTVANGSGTATGNVSNVQVTCGPAAYQISVSVTGLTGTASLVLQDDQNQTLTFTKDGTQVFSNTYSSGAPYSVNVSSQTSLPAGETCTASSNTTGTMSADVTISVTCSTGSTTTYAVSAAVSGLAGTLKLQDNAGDSLTFTSNGTQAFSHPYLSGDTYSVTVASQPIGQTCALSSNANGTISANVTVTATCTTNPTYTISVLPMGLSGTLVVQDDKNDTLTFTGNSSQAFPTSYLSGSTYSVSIKTQPSGETCSLGSNAIGTISSNITVTATCSANTSKVSVAASGLTGTLVVQDSQNDTLTFSSNNTQTFATAFADGTTYSVTVKTQPAGQTCTLSGNASGTISADTTVTATCVSTYSISVATTGLAGTLAVQDDKSDLLTFTTNNTQSFATQYASGSTYSVTIKTQPTGQTCTLGGNASGTISANTTVTATCVSNYTITVSPSGLTGTLVVQDNGGQSLTFSNNSPQTFSNTYTSGSSYSVSITSQPTGETCTLGSNASGTIAVNTTVTATCTTNTSGNTISVKVTGLSGSVEFSDDQGDTLTFNSNTTLTFSKSYTSGATYIVNASSQPASQACTPTYVTGTINSNLTIDVACATGATRALGTISNVSSISCSGSIKNGTCQQMTVSCPGVPDVSAYIKTNQPTGTPLGTVTYGTGTNGNGLYETIFTFGSTAVQNVLNAGFTTVQISWGTPFNTNQPNGWVEGTGGLLTAACRYATVTNWIYNNVQNNSQIPMCATANSGGAGVLAYALSQYGSNNVLSMAEVTSGPPTGRLDWGCGCQAGKMPVSCGSSTTLGTCFGKADAVFWDPAYDPSTPTSACTSAVNGTLPPGGLNFFLGDSAEAPGATYNFPKTFVNVVFGGADNSSAIPIGLDWYGKITSSKGQACVPGGLHSLANTLPGAQQIANDLIGMCKLQ